MLVLLPSLVPVAEFANENDGVAETPAAGVGAGTAGLLPNENPENGLAPAGFELAGAGAEVGGAPNVNPVEAAGAWDAVLD